mgnify:FL=1
MSEKIISLKDIRKTYDGKKYVLDRLDFSIERGELAVITGKSGSGKSTLMNIIGLLDTFDAGIYMFEGESIDVKRKSYSRLRGGKIGFIFQSYYLIESLSVSDNILMPLLYSDKKKIEKSTIDKMNSCLEEYGLYDYRNKKTALLSGGEKQRVAVARALIKDPDLIIADEPTGNLDRENGSLIKKSLARQTELGKSVIIVTHNKDLFSDAPSMYMLSDGRLEAINE